MKNIDLKLLAIIGDLYHTKSVSQTAENLAISQSAVSMSLAKLRKHFNDPLFVRTSAGMEPTPHAAELIQLLQRAEDLLRTALGHHVVFNPIESNRIFRLHSTDIAQVTLLPKLMRRLRDVAPSVRVNLGRISDTTPKLLESGDVDVAVGFILPMGAGFCQQSLFGETFVCAMRRNHPRVGNVLSLERFSSEVHLAISTSGTGHSIVERTLEIKGIKREVGLTVPSFLGVGSILASTDYLVTLPSQLAEHLARTGNIKVLKLPLALPSYVIMQHWHERYTHDPAVRWFRSLIAELFADQSTLGQRKLGVVSPIHESASKIS
ncbi:MAG TPA: LysR family transcriptional regulator [Bryobacteraceae bacterium]|nr:LysR family transcriptional regulator [Bryobacteraceae bacterium]